MTKKPTFRRIPTIRRDLDLANHDDSSSDDELTSIYNSINDEDDQKSEVDTRNSDLGLSLENMAIIDPNPEARSSDSRSPKHLEDSPDAMKIDEKNTSQSSSSIITALTNEVKTELPNEADKKRVKTLEDSASTSGALKIDAEHAAIQDSTSGAEKKGSDYKATISDSVSLNSSEASEGYMNVGGVNSNVSGKKRSIESDNVIGRVTDPFGDLARSSSIGLNIKSEEAAARNIPDPTIEVIKEGESAKKKARPLSPDPSAIGKGGI